jgi:hypothetical protein
VNFGAASVNLASVLFQAFSMVPTCGTSRSPKFKAADGLYLLGPLIWGEENLVLFLGLLPAISALVEWAQIGH